MLEFAKTIAALEDQNRILRAGIIAVIDLINSSEGVAGLHLNGDDADWGSLRCGGCYEEWLVDFDTAADLVEPNLEAAQAGKDSDD